MDLSEQDKAQLGDIGWHWDGAYKISANGETYSASRRGYPKHLVTAETTDELRELIRRDYFAWMATLRERTST